MNRGIMKTQIEIEQETSIRAKLRADMIEERNEDSGEATRNGYGSFLTRRFAPVLKDILVEDLEDTGAGVNRAALAYLRNVDPGVAAYLAVRVVINEGVAVQEAGNYRRSCSTVGRLIQYETVLGEIKGSDQKTYERVKNFLQEQSMQKPERIFRSMTKEAKKQGIHPRKWESGAYETVGAYLIGRLEQLGLCEVNTFRATKPGRNGKQRYNTVQTLMLTEQAYEKIGEIKQLVRDTAPFYLPCVQKPRDWITPTDGGYFTEDMQMMASTCILGGAHGGDVSTLLEAINALQSVSWKVNSQVLDVAVKLQTIQDGEEIVSGNMPEAPELPEHLQGRKKQDYNEVEDREWKQWKFKMNEWNLACKMRKQKIGRMVSVFDVANDFRDYPEIYFVYHADFRGRVYPRTTGPNPQGSDLQKAVLHFAVGKPLRTVESQEWFLIHGANKYGVDKLPLEGRLDWVTQNHEMIISIANDPVGTRHMWYARGSADCPFAFLAWCFEYKRFCEEGPAFISHIPIAMDGSCNGLQNFSALLADEVGGKATNLTPSEIPADIYTMVADLAREYIEKLPDDDQGMRRKWLEHGIKRSAVKRCVMTLPYGSTRYSARNFILDDYLRVEKPPQFQVWEYKTAAQYLSEVVWEAIGKVVVKAREAMDWLQACVTPIMESGLEYIEWDTPTGFRVRQAYKGFKRNGKITVGCVGFVQFNMSVDAKEPDRLRHKNGLSPNFIHSFDAAHMALTTVAARKAGIRHLAMIHDDFGTHAADAPKLYNIIREEFVKIYLKEDWIGRFMQEYENKGISLPERPTKGNLEISQVIDSKYFFS